MDLHCSTLTNMMGVKEPMLFAKFFVFQKRFSISANANLKEETSMIFFIFKNALFSEIFGLA